MVIEIEYWIFFSLLFLYKVDLQILVQHGFSHWLVREEMPSQEWELKNNTPQDSEQELLLENFKAAANCLTSLYRNSLNVEKRARNMGIQYTLESVLSWVGEQASTGKQSVSLEEIVSFCYQLSDQLGSEQVHNARFRLGERRSDVHTAQPVFSDKNGAEVEQANVAFSSCWFGAERKRSRKSYEAEFTSENLGPVWSDWNNKDPDGDSKFHHP